MKLLADPYRDLVSSTRVLDVLAAQLAIGLTAGRRFCLAGVRVPRARAAEVREKAHFGTWRSEVVFGVRSLV